MDRQPRMSARCNVGQKGHHEAGRPPPACWVRLMETAISGLLMPSWLPRLPLERWKQGRDGPCCFPLEMPPCFESRFVA
jgi:hypothetical protein